MSDPFAHARPNWSSLSSTSSPSLASTAPVLKIYEEAVQEPSIECSNIDSLYSGAQLDNSDRYDARILREDFCSTAVIAATWAGMDERNTSQGVDIDLVALQDTQRRLRNREEFVQLLQSPGYSGDKDGLTKVLEGIQPDSKDEQKAEEKVEFLTDSWAPGAATERFDRKRNKKLAKAAKRTAAAASSSSACASASSKASAGPRMKLLHSDVLDLPVPATSSSSTESALEPPDVIASLNYAMAYFHDRATLIRYLRMAKETLRPKTGVFITDMFGGPSTGENYPDQDEIWEKFRGEVGFDRDGGDGREQQVLLSDRTKTRSTYRKKGGLETINGKRNIPQPPSSSDSDEDEPERVLELMPAPSSSAVGTRAEWPRGKLKLVRTGTEHAGFEYWREDGPVDYMTNRFRMSLSFRFSDKSWLRDVFWYDFRVWSIKELTEAMEEVGFVRVKVHILPRNIVDSDRGDAINESDVETAKQEEEESVEDEEELGNLGELTLRTEKEERNKSSYKEVRTGEKVFANRSFSTYIIACAP